VSLRQSLFFKHVRLETEKSRWSGCYKNAFITFQEIDFINESTTSVHTWKITLRESAKRADREAASMHESAVVI
jgi:hypothetical protein